jgi:translation initiation factor 4E
LASSLWEEIVLAIIGEQFDVGNEICGAVCSMRVSDDIISIWNRTADNQEATDKIRDQMRRILKLPSFITIEYKKHNDSMVDKSSYKNPSVRWRATGTTTNTRPAGQQGKG